MGKNKIIVQLNHKLGTINPRIYGHFIEHLGRCMYEGLWVGPKSRIPNIMGFRKDSISTLKRLGVPVIRWPGGCFADDYHWMDGIGPQSKRPQRSNIWWKTKESNEVGTHEFLTLCELVGAEPYICVNVGTGSSREARDWVEYCNLPCGSSLSDLRAKNGHKKPWKVHIWGVGNEPWLCGGNFTAEEYAAKFRQYATFMRQVDSTIELVACGSARHTIISNPLMKEWDERVLAKVAPVFPEHLSLHHYFCFGKDTEFTEMDYYNTVAAVLDLEDHIKRTIQVIDFYSPDKKIGIAVDEWATWHMNARLEEGYFQQNTMRDAIMAGVVYNLYNRLCGRVTMTNLTQIANVLQSIILTDGSQMILTPNYHVLDLFRTHMGAESLVTEVFSPEFQAHRSNGKVVSLPVLSVSTSRSGENLTITVVNQHLNHEVETEIVLRGEGKVAGGQVTFLTSADIHDYNNFKKGEDHRVSPQSRLINCTGRSFTHIFEPKSVTVLQLLLT